jgi:hypothetical protein
MTFPFSSSVRASHIGRLRRARESRQAFEGVSGDWRSLRSVRRDQFEAAPLISPTFLPDQPVVKLARLRSSEKSRLGK